MKGVYALPFSFAGQTKSTGSTTDKITGSIDLKPTLLDLANIRSVGQLPMDGVSLKPLLLKSAERWPDRLYVNHFNGKTSVRSQRFRLGFKGSLFDMKNDPGQRVNVKDQFPKAYQQLSQAREIFSRRSPANYLAERMIVPSP